MEHRKNIRFNTFAVVALLFLLVASIVMNLVQIHKIDMLENTHTQQLQELNQKIVGLQSENWENFPRLNFFDEYAVIVAHDGTNIYHKYGCSYLETSNGFWILHTDVAAKDYAECPYCN